MDYKEFSQEADQYTSGLSCGVGIVGSPHDFNQMHHRMTLRTACFSHNVDKTLSLVDTLLTSPKLDDYDRIHNILQSSATGMMNQLQHHAISFASMICQKDLLPAPTLSERQMGLPQVAMALKLLYSFRENYDEVLSHLQELSTTVFDRSALRVSVISDQKNLDQHRPNISAFVKSINTDPSRPSDAVDRFPGHSFPTTTKRYVSGPYSVNSVAQSKVTVPYIHEDYAKLQVLTSILSSEYLHPEVREKGGAYGSGVNQSYDGLLSYYSFRDPNHLESVDIFNRAHEWVVKPDSITDQRITEAKMALFAEADAPKGPSGAGRAIMLGIDEAGRQRARDAMFDVTRDDLVQVSERYLQGQSEDSSVCIFGAESEEDFAKSQHPGAAQYSKHNLDDLMQES
eukprot:GFYU01014993.1.p1 GENE.GFYU01014993.1~~GFYU01014993.1.p1  ORF type:complete len:420 (-),score=94.98 GFYU01014993.1:519-1715(-)